MKWTQTAPANKLLDVASTSLFLRVDNAEEQPVISDIIDAATEYAESAMGASLLTRTITATFYNDDQTYLPHGPVQSITSVTDAKGNLITNYQLEGYGRFDYLNLLPATPARPLTVVYQAGYGATAASVPADIRQAVKAHVSSLYRNRESVADKSMIPVPHSLEDFYRLKAREVGVG